MMLDDIKKQIEYIKIRSFMTSLTKDRIYFWSPPVEGQMIRQSISKKLYDGIIKDIEIMDENQFILAYGRDPFSLNDHQERINTRVEVKNAKTSK